nr:23S rRNA (adenine(1618)-N(6))-methyltransferase RlmF [uncultured Pedobacter sp.]
MAQKKQKRNVKEKTKAKLHPRNKHHGRYNLQELISVCPELEQFVKVNEYEVETIDFANPDAVIAINKALLQHYYGVKNWNIPEGYLCPPIPGRADYIHNVADLLAKSNKGEIPTGKQVKCLDIGVGANCVYPLIGTHEYGWSFIGSDINDQALASAKLIIDSNPHIESRIKFRLQPNAKNIFPGALEKTERIHVTICNPPFYATFGEAQTASLKKLYNLSPEKVVEEKRNFGGQNQEIWCQGGEGRFVKDMIFQSKEFSKSCLWFTTLISNQSNLKNAYAYLKDVEALEVKTIPMGQGNKVSRILAWTFHTPEKQTLWFPRKEVVV